MDNITMLITSLRAYLSILYICVHLTYASTNEDPGNNPDHANYGVLLDAGSTSTKLKVYRWTSSVSSLHVPRIDLIAHSRHKPGLSSYAKNQEGLVDYIGSIVTKAQEDIPSNKLDDTPIFLMATAGLRFLSSSDASIFLEMTRSVMANTTVNPFRFLPSSVTILSGEEEGVYSWIAANYLLGFFHTYRPETESVGILEMGGGSTQIAFIPHGPIFSEEFQVTVAGRRYQLYVQSYLHYGSNSIKVRVAYELARQFPEQDELDNPCMLRGDTSRIRLEDGRLLHEKGTGSPTLCLQILQEILKPDTGINCHPRPCAIGSVYQPSVENITFYAVEAFTYAPQYLKVVDHDKILHIDKLEKAAARHCSKNMSQVVNESTFASDDCIMGLYIPTLLTVSYGFSVNTTSIRLTARIGEGRIDWALGAMLVELSKSFEPTRSHFAVTCKTSNPVTTDAKVASLIEGGDNQSAPLPSFTLAIVLCSSLLIIIINSHFSINIL